MVPFSIVLVFVYVQLSFACIYPGSTDSNASFLPKSICASRFYLYEGTIYSIGVYGTDDPPTNFQIALYNDTDSDNGSFPNSMLYNLSTFALQYGVNNLTYYSCDWVISNAGYYWVAVVAHDNEIKHYNTRSNSSSYCCNPANMINTYPKKSTSTTYCYIFPEAIGVFLNMSACSSPTPTPTPIECDYWNGSIWMNTNCSGNFTSFIELQRNGNFTFNGNLITNNLVVSGVGIFYVTGNLIIWDESIVSIDLGSTISVEGCANFSGDLIINLKHQIPQDADVAVIKYDCFNGEFSNITFTDIPVCYNVLVTYLTNSLVFEYQENCQTSIPVKYIVISTVCCILLTLTVSMILIKKYSSFLFPYRKQKELTRIDNMSKKPVF